VCGYENGNRKKVKRKTSGQTENRCRYYLREKKDLRYSASTLILSHRLRVPTPLATQRELDLRFVVTTAKTIAGHISSRL
jgi:hypothetical protein